MIKKTSFYFTLVMSLLFSSCQARQIQLTCEGRSSYSIVIPAAATATEKSAATVLQSYIRSATGAELPVISEPGLQSAQAIFIGKCSVTAAGKFDKARDDGFSIIQSEDRLFITGSSGQGTLYGVYYFLEKYLGCRKYDAGPAVVPRNPQLQLPAGISEVVNPDFIYRQSYYPMSNDAEYLRWHGLQQFEDLWGLWGHSFFKLIPPSQYFRTHPEYFALTGGQRRATQLCLSNKDVLRLTISRLKEMMADNPDAVYWSVSPNDEGGYCTCELCKQTDAEEGSPSGSLIRFVNKVAAAFPGKNITTLGYGYTAAAPRKTKPAENVYILVSSIDAFKEQPVSTIPSAAAFRQQLAAWSALTDHIFVWDYTTQFTNYLSPFPIQHITGPDLAFYKQQRVRGIFEQGSGDTYSDMAELNSYIQGKLLWNVNANTAQLTEEFCKGYYGNAGPFILRYLDARTRALTDSKRHLDIYGNPVTDIRGYLSPEHLRAYNQLLEQAQAAVKGTLYEERVRRVRLSLEYATLQQSRHFGVDNNGFLADNGGPFYTVRPEWRQKTDALTALAKASGVTELSEAGLSPEAYKAEWYSILDKQWPSNPIRGAAVTLQNSFAEDYPAKGKATLTDGMTGFTDFSYNWLCFYGQDMIATIDAGKEINVSSVALNFLEDQRHWILPPAKITIALSTDGTRFTEFKTVTPAPLTQKENIDIIKITATGAQQKARYIRITAVCPAALPDWRSQPSKKPMIACDEIFVFP